MTFMLWMRLGGRSWDDGTCLSVLRALEVLFLLPPSVHHGLQDKRAPIIIVQPFVSQHTLVSTSLYNNAAFHMQDL